MSPVDFKLLDSSVWLAYFFGEVEKAREVIESEEELFVSILSFYEIERKLSKMQCNRPQIQDFLLFIKTRAQTVFLDIDICSSAASFSLAHGLGAFDALILASSHSKRAILITGDYDFKGLEKVEIIG